MNELWSHEWTLKWDITQHSEDPKTINVFIVYGILMKYFLYFVQVPVEVKGEAGRVQLITTNSYDSQALWFRWVMLKKYIKTW